MSRERSRTVFSAPPLNQALPAACNQPAQYRQLVTKLLENGWSEVYFLFYVILAHK